MAEAIMSEHLVSVDRQRLGVMLAATYRVDEEVDVLEQLCDVNGVSNHAWRRLMIAINSAGAPGMCMDLGIVPSSLHSWSRRVALRAGLVCR